VVILEMQSATKRTDMIDGLYIVHFRTAGDEGSGTVVIANGSVNGGDFGYVYQGQLRETGQGMSATLEVTKFNPTAQSVFGPAQNFELEVSGPITEKGFELSGHVKGSPGHKIDITGRYFKPLV
jgi:hypothetical protein